MPRISKFITFASINNNHTVQFNFSYNSLSFILLIVFGLSLLIQLLYHWGMFSRVAFFKKKGRPKLDEELEPVSIVICARNEYDYLAELVPVLLTQDYPDYEIVIVNDCSDDETEEYLKEFTRHETIVKPVQMKQHLNFFNGKKFPLSMGIKSAKNDIIVLTDCNCMPTNDQWLRSVVNQYKNNTEIVIGYSPYVQKKSFLNRIIRFDALQQGLLYLSAAMSGKPYMGIGKNLSYRKELFFRNNGFISHYTTSVGDDDLFINKVATKKNTEVLIDAENAIYTTPTNSFRFWMHQKSSRYSTVSKYNLRTRAMLSLFYASQFLFYTTFIALLCLKPAFTIASSAVFYIPILVFFFLLRLGTQYIIYHNASKRLGEKGLLPGLILFDFLFAFLSPWLRLMGRMNVSGE